MENMYKKIEKIFIQLGFKYAYVGEKQHRYLTYGHTYCKITYLKSWAAFVIESADNIEGAKNMVLDDGDLYFTDAPEELMLQQIKHDIIRDYMN